MADSTDILRQDALSRRVKGLHGGHRIVWSGKDIAKIRDHIMAMPEKIFRAAPTAVSKFVESPAVVRRKFANAGISVKDMQPSDLNFLFTISSERVDLAGDVITIAGVDCSNFNQNPVVLNAHDSSELPIAASTAPWVSGSALMATAKFPPPGISDDSDEVAAAIRAQLVRGASVGFVPLSWSFTKDPARPFGVDFKSTRLLEWSVCSVPCNPSCLLVGAVSGGKSDSDIKMAARRHEAMAIVASARAICESISDPAPPTTTRSTQSREERIAEAAKFRRAIYSV
jgi:hypothetical protein